VIDQYTMQSALKSKNDFYVDETRGDIALMMNSFGI